MGHAQERGVSFGSGGGLRGNFFAPTAATRAERNFDWHLDLTRASRAHAIPPKRGGRALGEGIVIAHIDSGWAEHSQYNSAQIDIARSHNVVTGATGSENAKHSIRNRDADAPQITHGTATGSVILGGRIDDGQELISTASDAALAFGTESDGKRKYNDKRVLDTNGHLTGVAPKATMLPIKFISDSALLEITDRGVHGAGVFRLFDEDLINAIQYAIDAKAHVISLSVGGLLHDEVREIINTAVEKHNIIIAAAVGQTYLNNAVSAIADGLNVVGVGGGDSVVLPAAYSNVIAVAGCSPSGEPWSETHRGPNVDITAPADAIWIADYKSKDSRSGNATRGETLECASGTSLCGTACSWRCCVVACPSWTSNTDRSVWLCRHPSRMGFPSTDPKDGTCHRHVGRRIVWSGDHQRRSPAQRTTSTSRGCCTAPCHG
ncbi:MAG: S8/S53 family peptidase [Ignavibacteria bacterium]|nr:S8/S53 family peptidase [Ignavibacteria bacterium]